MYTLLGKGPASFFCMWIPSFLSTHPCWKDFLFLINYFDDFVINQLAIYVYVCFWVLSSVLLTFFLFADTCYIDYSSLIVSFEVKWWKFSSFVLLKICFDSSRSFVYLQFRIYFSLGILGLAFTFLQKHP